MPSNRQAKYTEINRFLEYWGEIAANYGDYSNGIIGVMRVIRGYFPPFIDIKCKPLGGSEDELLALLKYNAMKSEMAKGLLSSGLAKLL